ncbi:1,2-dihydroxy-3-keto-5-methylthiopentene dioxygenase [Zestomonas thermotolerans]|uniref:1,2-dihydroxy-3-keto-5-methylthiopentene dioxygenase n=1 Tax=Zestomonas thermotolerans TaxID=157784 RepID=UPI0023F2EC75|nr:acireductone dioxygenase [Pseudomonas thermotolerans]MBO2511345.1 acireductone dioxygenase [Gammaproteobacteria bacterium]
MSRLSVYHVSALDLPNKVLGHLEDIAATLAEVGVHFARRQPTQAVAPSAGVDELLAAYRPAIDALLGERGASGFELDSLTREHPQRDELRDELLAERQGDRDEVRLVLAGRGQFALHIEDHVYAVLCERNDLLVIPAGTRYWLDLGERPHFVAVRLLDAAAAGQLQLTGDDIASRLPRLDD